MDANGNIRRLEANQKPRPDEVELTEGEYYALKDATPERRREIFLEKRAAMRAPGKEKAMTRRRAANKAARKARKTTRKGR